jgi:hypothetical protein
MDFSLLRSVRRGSLTASLSLALLSGCSTPSAKPAAAGPVRRVDCSAAPDLKALGQRARETANRFYPAVCALLADGECDLPQSFDISFKKKLPHRHSGEARLTEICLNLQYREQFKDPANLDFLVVHEMTHVAQRYYRPIIPGLVVYNANPPFAWQEGIADYVAFKLGFTNGWECAECSCLFPDYRHGYGCSGAFLLYVEQVYDSNLVRHLNTALRRAQYTDEFFYQATGKKLQTLWAEFQQTRAFTPGAARMLELHQTLGFKEGKPPKDIERRLSRHLEEHADAGTRKLISCASLASPQVGDLQLRLAITSYFTQPGGTAEGYMTGLFDNEELPGFSKGQKGGISGMLSVRNLNLLFPAERSFTATKLGDPSTYHYTVIRPSSASPWQLQRAWRTDAEGQLADEYSLE